MNMQTPHNARKAADRRTKAPLPRDPSSAVREMLNTVDTLSSIYVQENTALKHANTKSFMALQDQKMSVAQDYQRRMEDLIMRKDDVSQIAQDLKDRLSIAQKEFSDLAAENKESIERMKRCATSLGNTLQNAAREAVNKSRVFSYGQEGRIHNNTKKTVSMGVSETA